MVSDDNWLTVVQNLRRLRQKWSRLSRVLSREGVDDWILGKIYVVLVQAVLLYRSETWLMTPYIRRLHGGFHYKVVSRLMERQPRIGREGGWVYPPLEEAMMEAGLE